MRGLTFRNKLQAYSNTKRRPEFQDQFMLIPQTRTFNWPFLQVRPLVGERGERVVCTQNLIHRLDWLSVAATRWSPTPKTR